MNILVVGPSWVGDTVMAQSLLITLKQQMPDCSIDVLSAAWNAPLLNRMPEVRSVITVPFKHGDFDLKTRYKLGKSLINQYHQAFVLPNSWKSALIPFFAKIPLRIGWCGEMRFGLLNDLRILNKKRYPRMVERYAVLAYSKDIQTMIAPPYPVLSVSEMAREQTVQKFHLSVSEPILALCPGAEFGPSKRWPIEYYAKIADQKSAEGWSVWIFGALQDNKVATRIQERMRRPSINLAGQTTLAEAIDLLSLASVVLTHDSGLMHVSAALNKPLVAIYGSTDPHFTPPLSSQALVLQKDLSCVPCFQRECPLLHHQCMKSLHPDTVLQAINSFVVS